MPVTVRARRRSDLGHRHGAGRQRAGLVGTENGDRAERLDRRQPAHQRTTSLPSGARPAPA